MGTPSKGGFEILRTRHLLYMDSVTNLNTVEGFSGGAKLQIDLNLWKFLHYAARLCGDWKARDEFGPPEYPAGNDDDNGNGQDKGNGGGDMTRKTERIYYSFSFKNIHSSSFYSLSTNKVQTFCNSKSHTCTTTDG